LFFPYFFSLCLGRPSNKRRSQNLEANLFVPTPGFRIEDGSGLKGSADALDLSLTTKLVENSENDMAWYRQYFKDKEHETFIGSDNDNDPFVLSIIRELDKRSAGRFFQYRAIVWLKTVSKTPTTSSSPPFDLFFLRSTGCGAGHHPCPGKGVSYSDRRARGRSPSSCRKLSQDD